MSDPDIKEFTCEEYNKIPTQSEYHNKCLELCRQYQDGDIFLYKKIGEENLDKDMFAYIEVLSAGQTGKMVEQEWEREMVPTELGLRIGKIIGK